MSKLAKQPDTGPSELHEGPLSEEALVRLAWQELFIHMRAICDTLNNGGCLHWFYLPEKTALSYDTPCATEHRIVYRVGPNEYVLRLNIDFDIHYLQFRSDPCPFSNERVIIIRDQQAYFCDPEDAPYGEKTPEETAMSLIFEFLLLDDGLS
jgi:hypothetical protein